MLSDYIDARGLLTVKVTPKAARNLIKVDETKAPSVHIVVTSVPENGKATEMVIKLLAKELGMAKSQLTLRRGATSRIKVFKIGE